MCMLAENRLNINSIQIPYKILYRSEGFALTGYDIPGCMDDGAWMLWENSSAAVAAMSPTRVWKNFSSFITESALPECADRSV